MCHCILQDHGQKSGGYYDLQEMVSDMSEVEQRSWERLAEWMKQRYHAECSAVSAMHRLASQAAFAGQPLPFHLDLQVCTPHQLLAPVGCSQVRCTLSICYEFLKRRVRALLHQAQDRQ